MKKIIVLVLAIVMASLAPALLLPGSGEMVSAAGEDCAPTFMGFRPWYYGLTDADCNIVEPKQDGSTGITFEGFVWTIVLNVASILFGIVGYLAIGFLIYGGYLYVLARGDAGRAAKGKTTIIRAIIGLVICIMATVGSSLIVNIITSTLGAS